MKKLIAMAVAILLTACIAVFAAGKKTGTIPPKKIDYQMSFSKIIVADDIDLRLIESGDKTIDITGKEADVENVNWKIKGDILYLESKKGSLKNKVVVTVSVNQLKEIIIKGQSIVSSHGYLVSPNLYVYLEAESYVSIKNLGQIYVVNSVDIELEVKKVVGDVLVGR